MTTEAIAKCAIILVDDEKVVLSSIKEQLKNNFKDKYIYETADNADEAMEVVDELMGGGVEVLIIVSDWLMPGIKGDELLINIHKKYPKCITILLTGHADEKALENAKKNANLFAYLQKPWDEKMLITMVSEALEKL